MNKKQKKWFLVISIVLLIFLAGIFAANQIIKNKIQTKIAQLPDHIKLTYGDISVNSLFGNFIIENPELEVLGKTTNKQNMALKLERISINDIGYWDYLVNDEITIDKIILKEAIVNYKHNPLVENESYDKATYESLKKNLSIRKIVITNSDIYMSDYETDSTLLKTEKLNFEITGLNLKPREKSEKITYKNIKINTKALKYSLNSYDNIFIDEIELNENNLRLSNLKLKTKHSKTKLSELLQSERDHFNMEIPTVNFQDLDFGFNASAKFYISSKSVVINQLSTNIYRDKLVADDLTSKPLYSEMLRDLNFDLTLNEIEIINGKISYAENVNANETVGRLDFSNVNGTFTNFGNTFGGAETTIAINSIFMDKTPLKVDWNFKVQDPTDRFVFKADLAAMKADQMNQFTAPNLKVKLEGELQQTYFTVDGNARTSSIDLKVKYDDFKVSVLKDNGKERKKLLSGLLNLFISKDSDDEANKFRHGNADQVERDVTKSVFNFVWVNISSGLLSAMAGDGEKEN